MSGSPVSSFSASFAAALVAPIEVPSGSRISKNSSVRVEVGKNCCCTRPKAAIAVTNITDRHGDDGLAPAQAELDHAPQRAVDAGVVDRLGIAMRMTGGRALACFLAKSGSSFMPR